VDQVLFDAVDEGQIGAWVARFGVVEFGAERGEALLRPGTGAGSSRTCSSVPDADLLDQVIGAFLWTRTHVVASRRVIAIDGKTVRGARTAKAVAPHLVAAFDHAAGTVLGQVAVAAKSNEIPAVRDFLACFDLTGPVVTVDAMHTQTDTATANTSAGGDYLFTVKKNQPGLHQTCKDL
jgi:hypothetical protein